MRTSAPGLSTHGLLRRPPCQPKSTHQAARAGRGPTARGQAPRSCRGSQGPVCTSSQLDLRAWALGSDCPPSEPRAAPPGRVTLDRLLKPPTLSLPVRKKGDLTIGGLLGSLQDLNKSPRGRFFKKHCPL